MNEEKIQDYVNGNLPEAELSSVAAAIAADPNLSRIADQYRLIYRGLRQARVQEIEKELRALDGDDSGSANNGFRCKWLWGLVLAALLLVALGSYQQLTYYSDAAVAERFFKLPPDPRVAGPQDESQAYYQAIDEFFAREYESSVASFSGLQSSKDYEKSALFFLPHAQFKTGNYTLANVSFSAAMNLDGLPEEEAELLRWNAMINELATGKDITGKLSGEEWSTYLRAKELSEELGSFWR